MEGSSSYYDWELNFKKSQKRGKKSPIKKKRTNSIGITEDFFNDYVKKWKKKNISSSNTS